MGLTQTQIETALRYHLKDAATTWSDAELDECITMAVHDLSRFVPREKYYDTYLSFSVTDESATMTGTTAQSLTYKPIKWNSVSVTDSTGATTYTENTDYTIDYINGTITRISTGSIESAAEVLVTYEKSNIAIDISSLTDIIKVCKVEYPIGNIPQTFAVFEEHGGILWITGHPYQEERKQQKLSETKHVGVWYDAYHSDPTADAAGSFPAFFDQIVVKGAMAYAWLIEAAEHEHQAATDLASARTELGLTTAVHVLADTALDAVSTHTTEADAPLDAILTLHTAVGTALDAANALLDKCDTYITTDTAPSMINSLKAGDDYITTINAGEDVAGNYKEYAETAGLMAARLAEAANGYLYEAQQRLAQMDAKNNEAYQRGRLAELRVAEAAQRNEEIGYHIQEADRHLSTAVNSLELATRYREMGLLALSEFHAILASKGQLGEKNHAVSTVK